MILLNWPALHCCTRAQNIIFPTCVFSLTVHWWVILSVRSYFRSSEWYTIRFHRLWFVHMTTLIPNLTSYQLTLTTTSVLDNINNGKTITLEMNRHRCTAHYPNLRCHNGYLFHLLAFQELFLNVGPQVFYPHFDHCHPILPTEGKTELLVKLPLDVIVPVLYSQYCCAILKCEKSLPLPSTPPWIEAYHQQVHGGLEALVFYHLFEFQPVSFLQPDFRLFCLCYCL